MLATDIPWDMDDFHFCYHARSDVTFYNNPEMAICHDRYPDSFSRFFAYRWKSRVRTGEKLISHPYLYGRIFPVIACALSPWVLLAALPFFVYYVSAPGAFWARTAEVSVFSNPNPVRTILTNIAQHALMFHWKGGTFARDNFPGLPMLDPLTGLLLIVGIIVLAQRHDTPARVLFCTLLVNLVGGVLSVSQEGGPYVYRTAAVIVPAFVIVGVGLEWLTQKAGTRWLAIATAAIIGINLYLYFGLEPKNTAAMRVMAYEPRVIGQEIARQNSPVWLNASDVLNQKEVHAHPGERYPEANPAVVLPPALRKLAIIEFSGRYDMNRSLAENLAEPRDIHFVER